MTRTLLRKVIVATTLSVVAGLLASAMTAAASGSLPKGVPPEVAEVVKRRPIDGRSSERPLWAEDEVIVDFAPGDPARRLDQVEGVEGAEVAESIDGTGLKVVSLPDETSVEEAVEEFSADPAVESVEPNLYVWPTQTIPDDPGFDNLWGLHNTGQDHRLADPPPLTGSGKPDADIDAPEAWDTQTGDAQTVIAVVDTGVDIDHPDLDASLWNNPGEIPGNDDDDDGNGLVDDVHGWDFGSNDASLLEGPVCPDGPGDRCFGYEHGTHVAGTIAAEMNNTTGVAGVCPDCKIMVLKFMRSIDTDGDGDKDTMGGFLSDELEALAYARRKNADIINASFSTSFFSLRERRAYVRLNDAGVLVVAAAGNSNLDNDLFLADPNFFFFSPEYPASFTVPTILTVAASNHDDRYGFFTGCAMDLARWRCAFTSWGHDSVDLAAPGVDVRSTVPGTGYATFNGTSMAAPHVAGIAGLVESQHPEYGPMKLKNAIMNSVDKPDSLRKLNAFRGGAAGRFTRTSGRANAESALEGDPSNATPSTNGNINGAKPFDGRLRGKVSWPDDINDVFFKRLKRNRTYKVILDGPNHDDFDLLVWKPGSVEIWQYEAGCDPGIRGPCKLLRWADTPNEADESVEFTAKKSRKYYFQVAAWFPNNSTANNSGPYLLRIKRI
jgi:subtilisin family serine protease